MVHNFDGARILVTTLSIEDEPVLQNFGISLCKILYDPAILVRQFRNCVLEYNKDTV